MHFHLIKPAILILHAPLKTCRLTYDDSEAETSMIRITSYTGTHSTHSDRKACSQLHCGNSLTLIYLDLRRKQVLAGG